MGEIAIVTSRPFSMLFFISGNGRVVTIGENIQKLKKFTVYFFQLQQKEFKPHIIFTITTELYKQNLDIVKTATFRKSCIFHPHALTRSGIWYIMPVKFEMIDKKNRKKGKVNKIICKQIKQTKRNKRQNKQY